MALVLRHGAAIGRLTTLRSLQSSAQAALPAGAGKTGKESVVVLGTGWGAFRFVRDIDTTKFDVTVVSPRDHMLFTPLLASTAVGTLEHRSILEPLRPIAARKSIEYYQASAKSIDFDRQTIKCRTDVTGLLPHHSSMEFEMGYDALVIAVGAVPRTFGVPGVHEHAFFMKEARHGRAVRERIHNCFEAACHPNLTDEERRALLHFVVVGGGPTGVEFAAELTDFIGQDASRLFPAVDGLPRITLLEAGSGVLSSFDTSLAAYALRRLRASHCDVRLGSSVKEVLADRVVLNDGVELPCGIVVWSTGVAPCPLVESLDVEKSHAGIATDGHLRLWGYPSAYALGDCASITDQPLPAVAQVAEQEGAFLAALFNDKATLDFDARAVPKFKFTSQGMLAYLGGYTGVASVALPDAQHSKFSLNGFIAWFIWRGGYMTKLGSWRNRMQVPIDWCKTFFLGRDVSRM